MKRHEKRQKNIIERFVFTPLTVANNFVWSKLISHKKITLKVISFILIFALVITNINISASAMEHESDTLDNANISTILSIEALDDNILNQNITIGDDFEKINFPEQLQVVITLQTGNNENVAKIDENTTNVEPDTNTIPDDIAIDNIEGNTTDTITDTANEATDDAVTDTDNEANEDNVAGAGADTIVDTNSEVIVIDNDTEGDIPQGEASQTITQESSINSNIISDPSNILKEDIIKGKGITAPNSIVKTEVITDTELNRQTDNEAEAESNSHDGITSNTKQNTQAESETETEANSQDETITSTKQDTQTDNGTETEPDSHTENETELVPDNQIETTTDNDQDTQTDNGTENESNSQDESNSQNETTTDNDQNTQTDNDTETEPDSQAENETELAPDDQIETTTDNKQDTQADNEAESESNSQNETITDNDQNTQTDNEAESELDSQTEAEVSTKSDSQTEFESSTEPEIFTEQIDIPVTWTLDSTNSSQDEFSSETIGDRFVYQPVLPEGYILAEDLELPLIVVNIVDYFSFEQSETVDNITITVKADKGVFPDTAKLSVKRIYNPLLLETYCEAADRADADAGNEIQLDKIDEKSYVFDICIVDDEGMELQPDNTKGTVTVEFSNPEPAKFDISDYNVYHIDEESGEAARLDTNIDDESELVAVEVDGFSPFVFRATTYVTVLFTGGGTIDDEAFTEVEKFVYASEDNIEISELPIPDFDSEDIEFDSWELGEDGAYYAKWNRVTDTVSGEYIKYNYLENGINIKGIKDEKEISTSYNDMGAMQVYLESPQPQNDSEPVEYEITNLNISSSGDIYTQINENLYVATAASIKDRFVEITYYIWNKGEEDIEDFNIGMSQDIQVGDNDKVSLVLESDTNGKYALMEDNGVAVKIYYQGDVVTDTTTFWTGLASKETENVFEDNPYAQTDIDSAIALSWKNIDIPAKGIVTKSYMFGCGDKQSLSPKKSVKVDTNGDEVFDTETRVKIGTSYRLPEAAKREGYRFDHYLCGGKEYNQGAVIYPREDMEFTAVFSLLESTVRIDLLNDGEPWEGQNVELYLYGEFKYHMTQQADGSYVNNQVVNAHYDIYVNGKRLLEDRVNVLAPFDPIQVSTTVEFHTIKITTTLDGVESSNAGVLSLRNNGIDDVYVLSSDNGVYYGNIQVAEGTYDIYVNKEDTDFDISVSENEAQIDFVTVKVNIEDDTIWNNARVEIRDADTNKTDFLEYNSYNENVATYTKIMPRSERQLNISWMIIMCIRIYAQL